MQGILINNSWEISLLWPSGLSAIIIFFHMLFWMVILLYVKLITYLLLGLMQFQILPNLNYKSLSSRSITVLYLWDLKLPPPNPSALASEPNIPPWMVSNPVPFLPARGCSFFPICLYPLFSSFFSLSCVFFQCSPRVIFLLCFVSLLLLFPFCILFPTF